MSLNKKQFKDLIQRVLRGLDPNLESSSADNLLLGTAAVESDFGTFLRQRDGGPALGIFDMERRTFGWVKQKYSEYYPELKNRAFEELEHDLRLAIIMARLRYRVVSNPLPGAKDIEGMARYWKGYYNTVRGKGTVEKFVEKYHRYVGEV